MRPLAVRYKGLLRDLGPSDPYADPIRYERLFGRSSEVAVEDARFYAALAEETDGPVLELGCGAGRVLLAMARAGAEVVGVDRAQAMLDGLARALEAEPDEVRARVEVVRADLRELRLGRRFPLVVAPFNTVLHLYDREDLAAFLATVAAHLAPGGRLVFDGSVPRPEDLQHPPERWMRGPNVRSADGRYWEHRERFTYQPLEQILYVTTRETCGEDVVETVLAHRQWFPAELELGLHANGFAVEEVFAGFGREPPEHDADLLVWVCRLGHLAP